MSLLLGEKTYLKKKLDLNLLDRPGRGSAGFTGFFLIPIFYLTRAGLATESNGQTGPGLITMLISMVVRPGSWNYMKLKKKKKKKTTSLSYQVNSHVIKLIQVNCLYIYILFYFKKKNLELNNSSGQPDNE